jgi:hypothetical protein
MLSLRTAKYVEARKREGDNFDYAKWLERVREEDAQAEHVPVEFTFDGFAAHEASNPASTPNSRDAPMHSEPVLPAKSAAARKAVYGSDQKAKGESPKGRLIPTLRLIDRRRPSRGVRWS